MKSRVLQKVWRSKRGGTAMILTILIFVSILYVTLTAGEIIRKGVVMGWTQIHSAKAYFAAEAGSERVLYAVRELSPPLVLVPSANDPEGWIYFDDAYCGGSAPCCNTGVYQPPLNPGEHVLSNEAWFEISYTIDDVSGEYTINSYGTYGQDRRVVELVF